MTSNSPSSIADLSTAPEQAMFLVSEVFKAFLAGRTLKEKVNEIETAIILVALKRAGGNKTKAAVMMGVKRTTLIEKCRRLGISHGDVQ